MCRLALLNAKCVQYLGLDWLEHLFTYLESTQGGDGMGVASLNTKTKETRVHKGVLMTPDEAARWIIRQEKWGADYFIFHTRMATHGSICTANCHPFKHNNMVLAHNGVDSEFGDLIGDRTDSEAIAMTVARTGIDTSFLATRSGVYIGFRNGKPYIQKGAHNTSLMYMAQGKAWCFASTFPKSFDEVFDTSTDLGRYTWTGATDKAGFPTRDVNTAVATVAVEYSYAELYGDDWEERYERRSSIQSKKSEKAAKKVRGRLRRLGVNTYKYLREVEQPYRAVTVVSNPTSWQPTHYSANEWTGNEIGGRGYGTGRMFEHSFEIEPRNNSIVGPVTLRTSFLLNGDKIYSNDQINTTGEDLVFDGGAKFTGFESGDTYLYYGKVFHRMVQKDDGSWESAAQQEYSIPENVVEGVAEGVGA